MQLLSAASRFKIGFLPTNGLKLRITRAEVIWKFTCIPGSTVPMARALDPGQKAQYVHRVALPLRSEPMVRFIHVEL